MVEVFSYALLSIVGIVVLMGIQYFTKKFETLESEIRSMSGLLLEIHAGNRRSYDYDEVRHDRILAQLSSLHSKVQTREQKEEAYGPDGAPVGEGKDGDS